MDSIRTQSKRNTERENKKEKKKKKKSTHEILEDNNIQNDNVIIPKTKG